MLQACCCAKQPSFAVDRCQTSNLELLALATKIVASSDSTDNIEPPAEEEG
jgi:hypothetical protein